MKIKFITDAVRTLFPHLHTPRAMGENEEKKYSVVAFIDKSDVKAVERINAAIDSVASKRWGATASMLNIQSPLHDGDGLGLTTGKPYGPDYHGCYFLTPKNTEAPDVVDVNLKPITDPNAITNGDILKLSIEFCAYEKSGRRGVSVKLLNVQLVSKGRGQKPKSTAAEDFGPVENQTESEAEDFLQ